MNTTKPNTTCLWCKKPLRKFHSKKKSNWKPTKVHKKCYKIWKINCDFNPHFKNF